jgi:streptogramin lyase
MTGALLGSVPTGPTVCLAMDATADALWVGNCETTALVRIDVATGEIAASIPLPFTSIAEESSVAAGPDGVFVLGDEGTIARVDPATNAVASTFAAPVGSSALRSSPGALWVTSAGPGMLRKLDPTTGSMLEEIKVGSGSRFLAVGEGAVWVQNNGDGTVSRVDLESEEVVATVTVSDLQIDGGDIAVGGGYVWARVSADSLVAQIDPATNVVVARYGPANGSGSVAADDDAAWISAHDVFTVFRVPFD